jgi:hypothetical protein
MDEKRFEELKAKAAEEGLTDEEAAELGRLYAQKGGDPYQDAGSARDADEAAEEREGEERRDLDALRRAEATRERDRAQAIPPGEASEPDYE